jgi:site-specific recombinase XerD
MSTLLAQSGSSPSVLLPSDAFTTDHDALEDCLLEYARKTTTLRTYVREVKRFFFWWSTRDQPVYQPLRTFTRRDIEAFRAWLANPPASCTGRSTRDAYRPLIAPMNPATARQSLIILQSIFDQLERRGFVDQNVFRLVKDKGDSPQRPRRRAPHQADMIKASHWLVSHARAVAGLSSRDALIWLWTYWLAARRHELEAATLGRVVMELGSDGRERWRWLMRGKGDKDAALPIPACALLGLAAHLGCSTQQLAAELQRRRDEPLIPSTRGRSRGLTGSGVYRVILKVNACIADRAGLTAEGAMAVRAATPHAARAFRTTHLYAARVEERHIQRLLRHAHVGTTRGYDETSDDAFHDDLLSVDLASAPEGL